MDDGVRIALTTYLPDAPGDGPFPAVIESVPYRKDDDCTARDWETFSHLAAGGIAGIRIDVRGTGASTGVIADEYVARERDDTLAILRWASEQEWCTGDLGMWGISWGGFSALQTAMLRPPQLKAIAPMHATHDRFACDVHYHGGSLHAQEQVDWPTSMVVCNALPPDPDIFGEGWFDVWMSRLCSTPQWPVEWLRHQHRDDYWLHGSPCVDYTAISCPTLLIGGWLDGYVDGMLALAENLTCPTRTVIGPWGHFRPATGVPAPTLDHFDLLARWFGHHLRGDDNEVMSLPPVTLFVQTEPTRKVDRVPGIWRGEESWPPPDIGRVELLLADLDHDRSVWQGPQWVGSHAPAWDRAGVQTEPSTLDDEAALTFAWGPLVEDLEILGAPEVAVTAATDRTVGLVAARLVAVSPEGETMIITRGSRNLTFPDDLSLPDPPKPGEARTVRFTLMACAVVVPREWTLRLALAGADFPIVWPPGQRFTLTIDPAASTLILPVAAPRSPERQLELPEAPTRERPPVEQLTSASARELDRGTAYSIVRRMTGHSERQPTRRDLVYASDQEWTIRVEDEDPASIRARSVAEMRLERPGWSVTTRGSLEISGDADTFRLSIELAASLDGTEVFHRRWAEEIARRWV